MNLFDQYSDQELLEWLQRGEAEAFSSLYRRYWDRLMAVAMHRLGDLEEAREVVQEVFCNLWRRREELVLEHTLNTYLSVAVKYEVLKRLSKLSRRQRLQEQALGSWEEAVEDVQQRVNVRELQTQLAERVRALPDKCRIIFQLSRDKGYTQKEIAAELGIAEKTVEAHLANALRKLRMGLSHLFTIFF
jgi:RNA polymerase sigma-70 factor (ECF subfamily)